MKVLAILALVATAVVGSSIRETLETGPACPPADPLNSPAGPLNVTLHPILNIDQGSTRGDLVATGLSGLSYDYTIIIITLTLNFHLTLPSAHITNDFTVTGYLDARPFSQGCIPSGNFTGSGAATIHASTLDVNIRAVLFANLITNKLSIRTLEIRNISFGSDIMISFGPDLIIGGSPVDWDAVSAGLKTCFDAEFAANKAAITEKIRQAGNVVIGNYTIDELLELIGGGGGTCPPPLA
jgi:hypothetical protein